MSVHSPQNKISASTLCRQARHDEDSPHGHRDCGWRSESRLGINDTQLEDDAGEFHASVVLNSSTTAPQRGMPWNGSRSSPRTDGGEVAIQVVDDGLLPGRAGVEATQEDSAGAAPGAFQGAAPGATGPILRGIPDGQLTTRGISTGQLRRERTEQSLDECSPTPGPLSTASYAKCASRRTRPTSSRSSSASRSASRVGAYIAAASSTGELAHHALARNRPGDGADGHGDRVGDRARTRARHLRRARPAVRRRRRADVETSRSTSTSWSTGGRTSRRASCRRPSRPAGSCRRPRPRCRAWASGCSTRRSPATSGPPTGRARPSPPSAARACRSRSG